MFAVPALLCQAREPALDTLRQIYAQPAARWPAPWLDLGVDFVELAPAPIPALTPAQRRQAALGQRLFFDRRLSASGTVACASCHRPDQGWTVNAPLARGHAGQWGRRNPPALPAAAARRHWGWDGASASLAARTLAPLTDPVEMGLPSLAEGMARLAADPGLAGAFPSTEALGDALAAYLRTLETPTRLDRFLRGNTRALNRQEIHGLHLFRTKARCINCHHGPQLTDERFHNLRISSFGERSQDLGRYEVTGRCEDVGAFRTPSLRHVGQTAPYMHNGLFRTLEGVIHLYARGGGEVRARNAREAAHPLFPCASQLSPHIRPLALTPAEGAALRAFLMAL
jgi:cytochrome c peroxidase